MSSISDALRRAEQERQRMRGAEAAKAGRPDAPPIAAIGIADVVLRRNPPETKAPAVDPVTEVVAEPVTPVAAALMQAPPIQAPAIRAQQQATETIVEDYTSKHKLNLPPSLVVYHERAGRVAEQYRRIRDSLMAGNTKREPQMLVVTSSVAGEGKTTTVLNLGLSLVEIRTNRVLLIDGNMHPSGHHVGVERPSLSALLKLQKEPGLVEMLSSDEEPQSFIHATPWHHLYVLPTRVQGTAGLAIELLKSPKLHAGLRALRSNFDWVLIDAPPALDLPDAGVLGGCSDGMIMTVALHHTPEERVQRTVRRLRSMNLPVKSCILTRQ